MLKLTNRQFLDIIACAANLQDKFTFIRNRPAEDAAGDYIYEEDGRQYFEFEFYEIATGISHSFDYVKGYVTAPQLFSVPTTFQLVQDGQETYN